MIAAAAVVATILVAWFFWQKQDNPGQIVQVPVINKKIDTGMEISTNPPSPGNKAKDPIVLSEEVKTYPRAIKNYTVKTSKHHFSKSNNRVAKDKEETTARNDDFIVMVNGKRITDEADAIAITKQSLSMVSRDLTNTVNGLKPIGR